MHIRSNKTPQQLGTDERSRIARDLREDLGARLLNQLSQANDPLAAAETRAMLAELRSLLDSLDPRRFLLRECVTEWVSSLSELSIESGTPITWTLPQRWRALALSPVQRCNPPLILRELLRNAAMHSHPKRIELALRSDGGTLMIKALHDGLSSPPERWRAARGLRMAALRTGDLGGRLDWSSPRAGWLQMDLQFPLPYARAHALRTRR